MRQNLLFASLRSQCPAPAIATPTGGTLTAATLWIGAVGLNRVGLNQCSTLQEVSWVNGDQIEITLEASLRSPVEDLHRVLIVAATTNDPELVSPLCWWRGVEWQAIGGGYFEEVTVALPVTLTLDHPDQVVVNGVVANPAALTTLTVLDGMQRYVTSLGKLFYYDPLDTQTPDGLAILDAGGNPGNWLEWILPDTVGVGTVTDVTGEYGCSRDIRAEDLVVLFPPPPYPMDGTVGQKVAYWVCNGLTETGTNISAGMRLSLEVQQSGLLKSQLFHRRVVADIQGYVRLSDVSLDTADLSIGSDRDFSYGDYLYALEKALPPGRGVIVRVAPRFQQAELDGNLSGAALTIKPYLLAQAGSFFPGYWLFGNIIVALGDRRRVYPQAGASLRIGSGAGLIDYFVFELQEDFDLAIPTPSVSNQKVSINSEGNVFWRGSDDLLATEALRAVVDLASGRSNPSAATAYTAAALNDAIQITATYPTAIRSDYPDLALRGADSTVGAELNAPFVVLYVQRQSDGQIREFVNNPVVAGATQQFTITNFTAGTVIGSLPSTPGDFGFWASSAAPALAVVAGAGSLAADSYRIYWGFRYDGSTASAISHAVEDGCIPEMTGSISELFEQLAALEAEIEGWQDGTNAIDVLGLTARGNAEFRALVNLWASSLTLNSDATESGADWQYVLQLPSGMTANQTLTLPLGNGNAERALVGDGAGVLQYASVTRDRVLTFNHNTIPGVGSVTANWFTLAAGQYLQRITCLVTSPWNGTTPTLVIGISGSSTKYIPSDFIDLKTMDRYWLDNSNPPNAGEIILLTYNASSATTGTAYLIAEFFA